MKKRKSFQEMVYSPNLNQYIGNNIDNYHCFVFIPICLELLWGIENMGLIVF